MGTSLLLSNPFPTLSKLLKPRTISSNLTPISIPILPIKLPTAPSLRAIQFSSRNHRQLCRKLFVIEKTDGSSSVSEEVMVGEDSAEFDLAKQKITSWIYFTGVLGIVLLILDVAWLDNSPGFGKVLIDSLSSISDSPEVVMLMLTLIFAIVHSGLASVRDAGEKIIGERAFRVLFAGTSLPLAVSTVVYFINHRYDGVQLWQLQSIPWLHHLLWVTNFVSFFFLYPSTFNLLEVAAVNKPKMHLWESGIMRITRHPQMVGQVMWCLAHTMWIGNSVAVAASVGLIGHHLFGVWNGDRGWPFDMVKILRL